MTLRWVPGWNGLTEPEAVSYVAAVEAADGQDLEFGVAKAINDFVVGCKNDGIWDAIKACCILAGARTLGGALVPLVGTAPTNYNFVAGDYDRKTGLQGDGSTKYLNSNRNNNADPQNNKHVSAYCYSIDLSSTLVRYFSSESDGSTGQTRLQGNNNSGAFWVNSSVGANGSIATGLMGVSRLSATQMIRYSSGIAISSASSSNVPNNANIVLYQTGAGSGFCAARLSFYSIGESLDLAKLDTRVSNLMTAIGAAIP